MDLLLLRRSGNFITVMSCIRLKTITFAAHTRAPASDGGRCGLSRNTWVGNATIRGVSGGKKMKVSICEALAARVRIVSWDKPEKTSTSVSTRSVLSTRATNEPANRQTTADFLVAVTDPNGRIPRSPSEHQAPLPKTAAEFAEYLRKSSFAQENRQLIQENAKKNTLVTQRRKIRMKGAREGNTSECLVKILHTSFLWACKLERL
ncbi:ATP-binding cassette transporter snq2 [Stygiomarasmius scandens]|uniref:ATP-binding cassette transporter snq2 n=1 Tax=Marasmiellus scandens TaxID=2682957 RepID=A0ABR1JZ49_9AGAR